MSTTSPSQEGVEGTASEVVWMITEESAILVMSTSLLGKFCILPLKEAHFMPARYKLYLVAQFVGSRGWPKAVWCSSIWATQSFAWLDDLTLQRLWWVCRLREKTTYQIVHTFSRHHEILDALVWLGSPHGAQAGCLARLV